MMTVAFLDPEGTLEHHHPDIFKLEKVEAWEDETEWELAQSISKLLKKQGFLAPVFEAYRRYMME